MKGFHVFCIVLASPAWLLAQEHHAELPRLPEKKRFIDKMELFAGPNASFNYGNKFVNNYKGEYTNGNYVENKRIMKPGYSIGLGVYHPIVDWLSINSSVLWEQKGSKARLDVPLNPVNDDRRLTIESTYTYKYLTITLAPILYIGNSKKWIVSLGGYYSFLKDVNGSEVTRYFEIDYSTNPITTTDIRIEDNFQGRKIRALRDDGGVNAITFIPWLGSFKKNDYGVTLGLGYSISIANSNSMLISLNSQLGLLNINEPVDILYNPPEKNNTIAITIAYALKDISK